MSSDEDLISMKSSEKQKRFYVINVNYITEDNCDRITFNGHIDDESNKDKKYILDYVQDMDDDIELNAFIDINDYDVEFDITNICINDNAIFLLEDNIEISLLINIME